MNTTESRGKIKTQALWDYIHTHAKTTDIAKKHAIPLPMLFNWVREEKLPRRKRGRRQLSQPSLQAERILTHAKVHGFSNAARHFNTTRQFVSSLAKRWQVQPPARPAQKELSESSPIVRTARRATRDVVVSFRLLKEELLHLRQTLPSSIVQSTRSPHKLARAAVLEHIEKSKFPSSAIK